MNSNHPWNTGSLHGALVILESYGFGPGALSSITGSRANPFSARFVEAGEMAEKIHAQVHVALAASRDAKKYRGRSAWTLRHTNTSPLKPERAFEFAYVRADASRRWNQIPVASGLTNTEEKHRALDIVEQTGPCSYRFVELKIGSDSLAYAAVELMLYGILYLQCRKHWEFAFENHAVMQAEEIELAVMAPEAFFDLTHSRATLDDARRFVAEGMNHLASTLALPRPVRFSFSWLVIDQTTLLVRPL